MLHDNQFEALTNNGIHSLFSDSFEGQQFTLQIITYMPSDFTFTYALDQSEYFFLTVTLGLEDLSKDKQRGQH